jgi:4-carboxymuconolactone decarboxylase
MSAHETAEGERQARRVFGDERYERSRTYAPAGHRRDLLALADEVVFGKIYARPGLSLEQRALCTISALTVLGHADQLRVHVAAALRLGIEPRVIAEVMTQLAMYAGFPAALNAAQILDEVTAAQGGAEG